MWKKQVVQTHLKIVTKLRVRLTVILRSVYNIFNTRKIKIFKY